MPNRALKNGALISESVNVRHKSHKYRGDSSFLVCRAEAVHSEADAPSQPASTGLNTVPTANQWELDFCSRPILDDRGKKVWELLICDADRSFEYAKYFPNNKINSNEVRAEMLDRCYESWSFHQEGSQLDLCNKRA